ncbi:MAG: ABC transporter substrate-binding protein [Acidimicrobiia bacterium]
MTHESRATRWRWLALLTALMLVVAACGGDGADDETSTTAGADGDTTTTAADGADDGDDGATGRTDVQIQVLGEPNSLDPGLINAAPLHQMFLYNVYEPLVELGSDGSAIPLLAESWDVSEDGTVYTFTLRDGMTFHDGSALDSEDVVATYTRHTESDSYPHQGFDQVTAIEAPDALTVQITLDAPSWNWLELMGGMTGVVLPAEVDEDARANDPIGSGPFEFVSWTPDVNITMERYDGYWGDAAPMETVIWRFIADQNAAVNALVSGEIDGVSVVQVTERLAELEANADIRVYEEPGGPMFVLALNHAEAPLDDLLVRQAIDHAIDSQAFIDLTEAGYGVPTSFWLPSEHPAWDDHDPYPYDPDRARELLAEAGYPDGLDITITTIRNNPSERHGELALSMLTEVGFNVTNVPLDLTEWVSTVFRSDSEPDFQTNPIGLNLAVPFGIYRFTCDAPGNYLQYCNEDVDALLDEADAAPTIEKRNGLLNEAATILADDVVNVVLFERVRPWAFSSDLEGLKPFRSQNEIDIRRLAWSNGG